MEGEKRERFRGEADSLEGVAALRGERRTTGSTGLEGEQRRSSSCVTVIRRGELEGKVGALLGWIAGDLVGVRVLREGDLVGVWWAFSAGFSGVLNTGNLGALVGDMKRFLVGVQGLGCRTFFRGLLTGLSSREAISSGVAFLGLNSGPFLRDVGAFS